MNCTGAVKNSCKCYAALDYIIDHPNCSKNDIVHYMVNGGGGHYRDVDDAEYAIGTCLDSQWAVVHRSLVGAKTFTATSKGKKIAEPIRALKWLREFVLTVVNVGAKTAEELDIQLALMGSHKFLEYDFLKRIYDLLNQRGIEDNEAFHYLKENLGMPLIFEIYAKAKEVVMSHKEQASEEAS